MKTLKALSMAALALSFLIAPLAAQTALPEQAQQAEAARLAEQQQAAAQAQAASVNAQTQAQQEAALKAQEERRKQIDASRKKAEAEQYEMEALVKTYSLKFVNPNDLVKAAKFYLYDSTSSGSTLTVRIQRKYVADFEALLKKLDVEKRNIEFQIYTIVATNEAPIEQFKSNFVNETRDIKNADLKRVLDEMKGLWNFKYYWVDSPSFINVKDGSEGSSARLAGILSLDLRLRNVQLRGDETDKQIVAIGEIGLYQTVNQRSPLIETTDLTLKEKSFLVVGVSGVMAGGMGNKPALILIISADAK